MVKRVRSNKHKKQVSLWGKAHKKERASSVHEYNRKVRLAAITFLGGMCNKCGENDPRILCFDHIVAHRKSDRRRTPQIAVAILKGSTEFQLLCHNHNWLKRHENHEYFSKYKYAN